MNHKVLRRENKKYFVIFLTAIYILFILIFGLIYQKIAKSSSGRAFVFQKTVQRQLKVDQFIKEIQYPNDCNLKELALYKNSHKNDLSNSIHSLLEVYSNERKRFDRISKFQIYNSATENELDSGHTEKIPTTTIYGETIGIYWASFYTNLFKSIGITHYKVELYKNKDLIWLPFYDDLSIIKLSLYISDKDFIKKPISFANDENKSKFNLELEYIFPIQLRIEKHPFISNYNEPPILSLSGLETILSTSMVFLDSNIHILKKIVNDSAYNYIDFLYFSTVTITTLGYGDILPNSSLVRQCVMLETVIGLLIMGSLIAIIFAKF